ncbi:MAG TPA: fibronectin type III domain-containing protein [Bacteroidales bacterium]
MKVNILVNFSRHSDDKLSTESGEVIDGMTGNTNFPDAVPTVAQVTTARNDFLTAHLACANGGKRETLIKNQRRTVLESLLRTLGLYVEANCKDDPAIALSSGFKIKKVKESQLVLGKPQNVKAEPGPIPGSIKISVDPVKGAVKYLIEWALTPVNGETVWQFDLGKSGFIIRNLIQGKEYAFKVAAIGTPQEKVFSDIITHFVA